MPPTTLYLLLAHLISDFLLQPGELVAWKHKSWKGVALHCVIHWLVMLVVLLPFGGGATPFGISGLMVVMVTALAVSHFFIDTIKIRAERRGRKFFQYFLLDQMAHILLLMAGAAVLGSGALGGMNGGLSGVSGSADGIWTVLEGAVPGSFGMIADPFPPWYSLYFNPTILGGACLAIVASWAYEIALYQLLREKDPSAPFRPRRLAVTVRFLVVAAVTVGLVMWVGW